MAYGIEILTTTGMVSSANMKAARSFAIIIKTAKTGSFTVPGFDSTDGFIYVKSNDLKTPPEFSWNNSTKTLTYFHSRVASGNQSANMTWLFMVTV